MIRNDSRHALPEPVRRLRRRLFTLSTVIVAALVGALSLALLAGGAAPGALAAPFAGATLALAAELLCVDLAVRRVARSTSARPASAARGVASCPDAFGV